MLTHLDKLKCGIRQILFSFGRMTCVNGVTLSFLLASSRSFEVNSYSHCDSSLLGHERDTYQIILSVVRLNADLTKQYVSEHFSPVSMCGYIRQLAVGSKWKTDTFLCSIHTRTHIRGLLPEITATRLAPTQRGFQAQ